MTNSLADSLSWPVRRDDTGTSSSETTPGSTEPTPWIVVAHHLMPAEAVIIKGRLESEGLVAIIQQEAMGQVLGLTVGPLGAAKVLVPEPQAEQALAILAETFEADESDEFEE